MINALRNELSLKKISHMTPKEVSDNIDGIKDIIFDQFLDGLPENYDQGGYYLNDQDYQTLSAILSDLEIKKKIPTPLDTLT